jgi:hypothetical protein
MPTINLPIVIPPPGSAGGGPLLDVVIAVTDSREQALKLAGETVPNPVVARVLVDTGASHTMIEESVLKPLALTPTGSIGCHTPTTAGKPKQMSLYDVKLTIPAPRGSRIFAAMPISAGDGSLIPQGIHGLLGRDVLKDCVLVYNGELGIFTLNT